MTMKGKIVTHAKLQYYRHNYCLVCMTGLLGCRWHRYQQSTRDSRKRDLASFAVLVSAFLYTVFFFYFWLVISNDNYYITVLMYHKLGYYIPWYPLALGLSSLVFAYLTVIMALCMCHTWHGHQLYSHPVHLVLVSLVLTGCVVVSVLLSIYLPREWTLLYLSLQVYGPFLQLTAVLFMTSIFWLLCRQWFKLRTYAIKCVWLLLFVLLMLGLYLSPLAVDSPLIRSETPPKPNIVALGGAVQVAPENTLMAFQKALDMGVNKLHTTVQISADGVPFLFGDDTLERTTNAESLLPGNASLDPMRHTWVNLTSLDAGSWFLEADPWDTADSLKQQDKDLVSKQGLLSLEDFLQFLSSQSRPSDDMTVFLHYRPLDRHHQGFKDINVAGPHVTDRGAGFIINPVINASALDLKVFATPVTSDRLKGVQGLLETPLSSAVASLVSQSDVAMLELGDVSIEHIRELQRANVSVGVQEVNSEWLLSLLWCVGVEYVATHDIGVLLALGSPVWRMSKGGYLAMWISVDLFSVIVILVMFIVQRVQLYGTNFSPESISLNTGRARTSYRSRTMKEKLLREGGIIEAVDDMEGSNAGAQDADGGVINEPVYCMTSGHQAYSLTSLSAIRVEDGGHSGVVVQAASAAPQPS